MRKNVVSIIMPVYNGEKTLHLALNSLLNQTYTQWECIIIDDCSTDDTQKILKKYSDQDQRFLVISLKKNQGRGNARNVGLDNCHGEYISFLDCDDFLHPDKILKQISILASNPQLSLVSCSATTFNSDLVPQKRFGVLTDYSSEYRFGTDLDLVMPSVMFKSKIAKGIHYNLSLDVGEDIDFISQVLDRKNYYVLSKPLYFYRIDDMGLSKILYYTKEDSRRGLCLLRYHPLYGLKIILSDFIKYMIYFIIGSIMGSNFFLKRRGCPLFKSDIDDYQQLLSVLLKMN